MSDPIREVSRWPGISGSLSETTRYSYSLIIKEESNLWEKTVAEPVYAKFEHKPLFTYKK